MRLTMAIGSIASTLMRVGSRCASAAEDYEFCRLLPTVLPEQPFAQDFGCRLFA
jgi:hypothetical protein